MKILIIRNFPSYLDVKFNTYNIQEVGLAKALTRKGHNVDIVFWTEKEEKEEKIFFDNNLSITVYYKKGKKILKNAWYPNLDEMIKNYDIIQSCEYNQIQSWYLAKKYHDKLTIYHGPYYSKFNKKYNFMCKLFDVFFLNRYKKMNTNFIVKSNLAKKFLIDKGILEKNISVVGVGIDLQVLTTDNNNSFEFLDKIKKDTDAIKLLYIGRIEKRRNPKFIIDILKTLTNKGENVNLYMIGQGDKDYVEEVKKYIQEKDLNDHIVWQEKCEQKYLSNVYKQADIFLLPTEYEIFGMVLLEAMYYGCIAITNENGGSNMLIENDINGIIIKEKNAQLWADKIIQVINDKEKMKEISINAYNQIEKNYLWDSLVHKFIEGYNKIKNR